MNTVRLHQPRVRSTYNKTYKKFAPTGKGRAFVHYRELYPTWNLTNG